MKKLRAISFGCHGIPDRCFSYNGRPMSFCSRCLGSAIGHVFSFLLFIFGLLPNLIFAIVFVVPLAIDWSLQEYYGIMSNNYRRLVTGVMGGLGVGIIIWKTVIALLDFVDLL